MARLVALALAFPAEPELSAAVLRQAGRLRWETPAAHGALVWSLFLREMLAGGGGAEAWALAVARVPRELRARLRLGAAHERAALRVAESGDFEGALERLSGRGAGEIALAPLVGGALALGHGAGAIPARWRLAGGERRRLERFAARLARRRHESIYRDFGAPPMSPGRTLGALFTGRHPLTDLDAEQIAALGCRIVVDLRQPREWQGPDRAGREALAALPVFGVERLHLPTRDGEALADADLARAVEVAGAALERRPGAPAVSLHCKAGIERTASVVLAAHALGRGLSVRAALAEIQRADPRLRPLSWQIAAVERFVARARAARPG